MIYKDRYAELKNRYRPDLEIEFTRVKDNLEEKNIVNSKILDIIEPIYNKFNDKKFNLTSQIHKYKELEMIEYLTNLLNKFYNDNKYLLQLVTENEQTKKKNRESLSLPFVENSISKNGVLIDIRNDLIQVEKMNNDSLRDMSNLMQFINDNFKDILIEESK